MISHTPTPWQYTTNVGPTKALIVERDGSTVMEVRRTIGDGFPTNVAFVIRACNAHDELVSALHAILNEPFGCRFCDSGKLRTPDNPEKTHDDDCGFLLARAALAKAEA
jgi:hypothetical protein